MTVSALWDHEIGAYLFDGTPGKFDVERASGWLDFTPRPRDHDLSSLGVRATSDTPSARVITLSLVYVPDSGDTAAEAFEAAADLLAAWTSPTADVELHAMLPGADYGHVFVVGRCRPLVFSEFDISTNHAELYATATFLATDPTIYPYVAP